MNHKPPPQQQQQQQVRGKGLGNKIDPAKSQSQGIDLTSLLSDELLLKILTRIPGFSPYPCSLVCKRWLRLQSSLRRSLRLHEWGYLESGRLRSRFPNLTSIDLTQASVLIPRHASPVLLTHGSFSLPLSPEVIDIFPIEKCIQEHEISPAALDNGLKILGDGFPALQKLSLVEVFREKHKVKGVVRVLTGDDSKAEKKSFALKLPGVVEDDRVLGLAYVARSCPMLQELELLQCTDEALVAISCGCQNIQILRLVGLDMDSHLGEFTDVGLTILANRFNRIVKLELMGCEASYHGIAAVGQCCVMLEELTISTRGFHKGWVAALSRCSCLKTLSLVSCRSIDADPGPAEYLGHCPALYTLKLSRCDLRDRFGFAALVCVCRNVRELMLSDCWGLDDETLSLTSKCRRLKLLAMEGCSLVTTGGLEAVILCWKELQRLRVTFCDSIRDSEVSPALANRFACLQEFRWRPDTRSLLAASLAGTGVGLKGGRFFKA